MTEHAIYQQSKQLAGLSITNSSGTKVSILNDSPSELEGASSNPDGGAQQVDMRSPHATEPHGQYSSSVRSPRSPHFRDRAGVRDYFSEERRDPYYYPSSSSSHKSHRHRSESYETGRSTSLTNAATPFRSGFDTRGQDALANSQRSRSLSSGAQLYPYSNGPYPSSPAFVPPPGSSPLPFFMRAFSEDVSQDDHDGYRGYMGHPGLPEGLIAGPSFSKRKYSCTHPGCNKRFTTSGHLARHNRIHTGERNFACLMPGCPSKFSRQDNMMQHYRTHISPKSRRGGSKKYDPQDPEAGGVEGSEFESAEYLASPSQDNNNNSPSVTAAALPPTGSSRHGSRHNSPPRSFSSEAQQQQQQHGGEGMDCDDRVDRPESRQHSQDSPRTHGLQSAAAYPPPLPTSTTSHHRERERGEHHLHHHHHQGGAQDGGSQPWPVPDSPSSPMTQVVERMEDVASTRDQQLFYYRQQQQYQQQYQQEYQQRQQLKKQRQQEAKAAAAAAAAAASGHYHATAHHLSHSGAGSSSSASGDHRERDHSHRHHHHGGHGSSSLHGSGSRSLGSPTLTSSSTSSAAELHPRAYSYSHSQHTHSSLDRPMMSSSNSGGRTGSLTSAAMAAMSMAAASSTPLSPQSTPVTPTKYRFDPIQDCIQQERRQREEATL